MLGFKQKPNVGFAARMTFNALFMVSQLEQSDSYNQPIKGVPKANRCLNLSRFPALYTGCVFFVCVLIGSLFSQESSQVAQRTCQSHRVQERAGTGQF